MATWSAWASSADCAARTAFWHALVICICMEAVIIKGLYEHNEAVLWLVHSPQMASSTCLFSLLLMERGLGGGVATEILSAKLCKVQKKETYICLQFVLLWILSVCLF